MSTGQQIGLIGSSVRVQSLPTASAATFGEGNRFYTLIGQQAGYITGHTYRTVMANDVYSWEDVRNELMLLALVDGTITANSSIEVALSNFNRQPLVDNLLIVYSNANQYALMKVSAVTSTAATLIVKDNSEANIVSTKGATGAAGVGITNATAGESIVADGKTTTPITFSFSDGTTKEFNVEAQNGTDGAQGVGVKYPSSGIVDLGTVLTDESKFATSAQGTKADNAMPKAGGTFTGNISVPSTITFTDENNPFIKMRTGGTDFYFQSTSGQFGLGPTWNKATHWDSNGNVTFPTTPKVGSSSLALKTDLSGKQDKLTAGSNISISGNTISATVPTVNNGTLTIQKNGTDVATFTANQSTNATANITVPVKVSELTNDSGFTTNKGTVTQVKINGATKSPNSAGLVDLGTGFAKTADLPIKSASLSGTTLYLTL